MMDNILDNTTELKYLIWDFVLLSVEKVGGHQTFMTDVCNGEDKKRQKIENILRIQAAYLAKGIRISFKLMKGGTTNDGEQNFKNFPVLTTLFQSLLFWKNYLQKSFPD